MPDKFELIKAEVVTSTAERLKKAAEQLTQIALDMQQHGLKEAYFAWTERQFNCLDVIIKLASRSGTDLELQIVAKHQGRPSQFDVMKKKSARDVAARKLRNANVPAKPRGRPRKNPA